MTDYIGDHEYLSIPRPLEDRKARIANQGGREARSWDEKPAGGGAGIDWLATWIRHAPLVQVRRNLVNQARRTVKSLIRDARMIRTHGRPNVRAHSRVRSTCGCGV